MSTRFPSTHPGRQQFTGEAPQATVVSHSVHSGASAAWAIRQATRIIRRTIQTPSLDLAFTAPLCGHCTSPLNVFKVRGVSQQGTRFRVHWRCPSCNARWAQYVLIVDFGYEVLADLCAPIDPLPTAGPACTP